MNISISDTFDNVSFTTSGQIVCKEETSKTLNNIVNNHTRFNKSQTLNVNVDQCLKISFDDSAFLNDSFSFSKHVSQLEKENIPETTDINTQSTRTTRSSHKVISEQTNTNKTNQVDSITPLKTLQTPPKQVSDLNIRKNSNNSRNSKNTSTNKHNISLDEPNSSKKPNFSSTPQSKTEHNLETKKVQKNYQFSQSDDNKLSNLGLPPEILQKYECRNVTRIFPWQLECLSSEGVLESGKNLIYSAPTSAGKTLVAEILAVKTVLERQKKVIFILPFVSVVREKMFYFQDIFGSSGIRVEGFMGSYNPPGGFKNVSVAICTIEKANSLINRLLDEGKISDIGAVIVDELHLIGDSSRGYLLELLLTKLNYISKKDLEVKIQVIGMSATLPNLGLLGTWLNASLYVTDFRPVPLNEQCLVSGEVFNSKFELTRTLGVIPELVDSVDTDNVLQLSLETVLDSCSVLIFCPSKNWCESLSVQIATAFFKIGRSDTKLGEELRLKLPVEPIKECLEQLKRSPAGLDDILQKTVSFGVAFHHAGLTMDERDIIEGGFRSGGLRVLVATSTLSSGVNLPARRVIIRSPTFFGKPIDVLSYKQMVGRAGRMGKDTAGESILICQKKDVGIARDLISGDLEPITSCLEGSGRLKRALLEVIASGVATTPEEIDTFGRCTLLSQVLVPTDGSMACISDSLEFLIKHQFVRLQVDVDGDGTQNYYVATPLAKACLNSSMPPEEGLALFAELEKARQCFVLETELHLIYLVTPYSAQIATINWMQFLELWEKLPGSMKRVGELVGIKVSFIINCSRGKVPNSSSKLSAHRRFYTALALQDLVNEVPLNDVCDKFGCNRGALQSLQQSAATFAGMVTAFSKQLGWNSVELLIGQFQDRLQFGVSRELLDLMRLPILNGQRARVLFNSGIEGLVDLAACNVLDLENILHKAKPFESKEREGESKHDAERRNNLRTIFITGKQGLTELEAAKLMISDARKYLQYEIGLQPLKVNWTQNQDNSDVSDHSNDTTEEKQTKEGQGNNISLEAIKEVGLLSNNDDVDIVKLNSPKMIPPQQVNVSIDDLGSKTLDSFEICSSPTSALMISTKPSTPITEPTTENDVLENDFDLTSLRLSSSSTPSSLSSTPSISSNLKEILKKDQNLDDFNDSFSFPASAQIALVQQQQNVNISKQNITEICNNSKNNLQINNISEPKTDDSLLTKAFMDSFNESMIINDVSPKIQMSNISNAQSLTSIISCGEAYNQKNDKITESNLKISNTVNNVGKNKDKRKKRRSDDIFSSSGSTSASNCSASSLNSIFNDSNTIISDDDIFSAQLPSKVSKILTRSRSRRSSASITSISSKEITNNYKNLTSDHNEMKILEDSQGSLSLSININLEIINICDNFLLFNSFMTKLKKMTSVSLSLGCEHYEEEKQIIGIRINQLKKDNDLKFVYKTTKLHGLSIYWKGEPETFTTYYIEFDKLIKLKNNNEENDLLKALEDAIMKKTLKMFNAKEQLKLLFYCLGWKVDGVTIEDPRVGDWLLDPEGHEASFDQMVKSYAPNMEELLSLTEHEKTKEDYNQNVKIRSSVESLTTWSLIENVTKRLLCEDPQFVACYVNEMKVITILTQMEINGMPVNVKILQSFADSLKNNLQSLESEAFSLAGRRFSFTSSSAVSKVLKMRPNGLKTSNKRKVSTNKAALVQYDHPLAHIIIQWRKINATLTKMVFPLLRNITDNRIRGTCITHNSTGRISMHEPNLQNVPRDFEFFDWKTTKTHDICIRGAFSVCGSGNLRKPGTVIVAADYCQLELRLLAHLSNDLTLGKIMRSDCDIFKAIAAKWRKIDERDVDDVLRQQTKQICYGIIYGIGNKTLADQMNITEDEALEFTDGFHRNYPGIKRFIKSTIEKCSNQGYVETLLGRRRYLPGINSSNQTEKSKAERQAVNTTVQGSAADIAKQAMILVDQKVTDKFRNSRNGPKLILQLHDELLYEVPLKYEDVFAKMLKKCMQESVKLSVPLPVKVQSGTSWGELFPK